MPFVPAANTASIDVVYSLDGQRVENTLYALRNTAWTPAQIQQLAQNVTSWAANELLPQLASSITLLRVETRDISVQNGALGIFVADVGTIGGVADESEPNNVAACVSFRTGIAGRSFRGRNYVAAIPDNAVNTNTLTNAFATAILAAYGELNATWLALTSSVHVVLSRFSGVDANGDPIPRAVGLTTPVTAYQFTDLIVDSQRGRLPGRGS